MCVRISLIKFHLVYLEEKVIRGNEDSLHTINATLTITTNAMYECIDAKPKYKANYKIIYSSKRTVVTSVKGNGREEVICSLHTLDCLNSNIDRHL